MFEMGDVGQVPVIQFIPSFLHYLKSYDKPQAVPPNPHPLQPLNTFL